MRAWPLGEIFAIQEFYRGLGRHLSCNRGSNIGCDTAQDAPQYGEGRMRHGAQQSAGGAATKCTAQRVTQPGACCDTTGRALRHDRACAATRPGQAYDMENLCAQAGPKVGALCTRLSFDSMHCSESLFMSTAHEVLKK